MLRVEALPLVVANILTGGAAEVGIMYSEAIKAGLRQSMGMITLNPHYFVG